MLREFETMASKIKQVGKGDIRKLMKESKTKINSPLGELNESCLLGYHPLGWACIECVKSLLARGAWKN